MTQLDNLLENRVKKVGSINNSNKFSDYISKHDKSKKKKMSSKEFRKRLLDSLDKEK